HSEYWRRVWSLIRTSRWAPAVNDGSSRPAGSTSSKEAMSCASRVILLTRSACVVFASSAAASIVTSADIGCPLGRHSIGGGCHRYKRYFLIDLIQEFRYQEGRFRADFGSHELAATRDVLLGRQARQLLG